MVAPFSLLHFSTRYGESAGPLVLSPPITTQIEKLESAAQIEEADIDETIKESTPPAKPAAINKRMEEYVVAEYIIAGDGKVFDVTII